MPDSYSSSIGVVDDNQDITLFFNNFKIFFIFVKNK